LTGLFGLWYTLVNQGGKMLGEVRIMELNVKKVEIEAASQANEASKSHGH